MLERMKQTLKLTLKGTLKHTSDYLLKQAFKLLFWFSFIITEGYHEMEFYKFL